MTTGALSLFSLNSAQPLHKRVPLLDENGAALSDFMMIIPKLRLKPQRLILGIVREIEQVLNSYRHAVVFADLNMALNVLWVSFKPLPGMCTELAAAIRRRVPEALLVGHMGPMPQ